MQETLDYLYGLQRFGMKLGLETMTKLMEVLDNPERTFKSIHVAGTNGKGSTCAFLANCLKEAGYNVGLYTSPHLVQFNERIQINGKQITDEQLVELTQLIKNDIVAQNIQPTFFEFTTALAFLYFSQEQVDIAIIEVGLGGRLDATNVITPLVSVITPIGFDHQIHLGTTKKSIAKEKAGIIKNGVPLVVGKQEEEVKVSLNKIAKEKNSQAYYLYKDLNCKKIEKNTFSTTGVISDTFRVTLLGDFQLENAATAILALHVLAKHSQEFNIPTDAIKRGLYNAVWPGRLQFIEENLLVDGAHNIDGIAELKTFISSITKKKVLVLGIKDDKNFPEIVSAIVPYVDEVILTEANFSPTKAIVLKAEAEKYHSSCYARQDLQEALELAKELAKESIIICTGSLYLIGDILRINNNKEYIHQPTQLWT